MEMVRVACPGCQKEFDVQERFLGKTGACPKCSTQIKIERRQERPVVRSAAPAFLPRNRIAIIAGGAAVVCVIAGILMATVFREPQHHREFRRGAASLVAKFKAELDGWPANPNRFENLNDRLREHYSIYEKLPSVDDDLRLTAQKEVVKVVTIAISTVANTYNMYRSRLEKAAEPVENKDEMEKAAIERAKTTADELGQQLELDVKRTKEIISKYESQFR